jgi:hypothetical protein
MSHEARLERNAQSKASADHDGEEWSVDEIAFLLIEFPKALGAPEDEAVVAECLGRTIEACRQRFYDVKAGRKRHVIVKKTTTSTTTVEYRGHHDDPDDCWWSPDYYTDKK